MTMQTITPRSTILAGQRYRNCFPGGLTFDSEVVVDRLVQDELGMYHVSLLDLTGREISLFADQFDAVVEGGELSPLGIGERVIA